MATEIKAEQRTPEWYAARLGKATASRFSDIMARTRTGYSASRKNYMAELVTERLTNQSSDSFTSSAMQWGIDNEPLARLEYELTTGNETKETGLWIHDTLDAGASPDGFVNSDGLLEIKCPNTATHIETLQTKKIPRQYIAQVQGQLWITNKKWCDFVSFDPRLPQNAQMVIIRAERDEGFIEELEQEIKQFLTEVKQQVKFVESYRG